MMQSLRTAAVLAFCSLLPALAQTVTVTLSPARDATLYDDPNGALANGGGQYVFLGQNPQALRRRPMLAFDIASVVPAGARVVFAQLTMAVTRTSATSVIDADIHPVLADWGEGGTVAGSGEGGGGPAQPGDATWLYRFYPGQPWATPGGDFGPSSARFQVPLSGNCVVPTTTSLIADVQIWLEHPNLNFGWLLKTDENQAGTARRLDSSENLNPATRPVLTVTYLPAGNALSVGNGCQSSSGQTFAMQVQGQVVQGAIGALSWTGGIPGGLVAPLLSYDVTPAPLDITPGCSFWLRFIDFPTMGFKVLDPTGSWAEVYQVPAGTALFGQPFAMQSVLIDLALPLGFTLSNAHLVVIG